MIFSHTCSKPCSVGSSIETSCSECVTFLDENFRKRKSFINQYVSFNFQSTFIFSVLAGLVALGGLVAQGVPICSD